MADYVVKWHGKKVFTTITKANVKAMIKSAQLVQRYVKEHWTLQGDYRPYKRGKKVHWSSRPSKPPALDLGHLRSSIMTEVTESAGQVIGKVGPDGEYIAARVPTGTDINYGLYMELGTKNIEPRPFLRPALKRNQVKIEKIFREANK